MSNLWVVSSDCRRQGNTAGSTGLHLTFMLPEVSLDTKVLSGDSLPLCVLTSFQYFSLGLLFYDDKKKKSHMLFDFCHY